MRFSARTAVSFAPFALLLVACGSSSSGGGGSSSQPVIDSIDVPGTFSVSGTTYSVTGTLTYHDDGASVTQLHEKIPAYSLDSKITISGASGGAATATVELGFQAASALASGTVVEIDVSVLDDNNVESNVEVEQITVP